VRRIISIACLLVLAIACGKQAPTPGVTPTLTRSQLLDPQTCGGCHPVHFDAWAGSMHALASDDPVFLAMNQRGQRETNGTLGPFCVKCHAPMAVHEGATSDGLNLASVPASLKGVTCYFCHSVDAVAGTHNNPLHLASDNVMRGEYKDPMVNRGHASMYSTLHDRDVLDSAQLCGTCHDIQTDHGANIERTLQEWESSAFAQPSVGSTCGTCHMNESTALVPIANAPGAPVRRLHAHNFPGVDVDNDPNLTSPLAAANQAFLDTTLQAALCVVAVDANHYAVRVIMDNVASGHNWPSGSAPDRRAWAEVVAYQNGTPIYQSGVVANGNSVTALDDPDLWLLRDCLLGTDGNQVNMFWEAASYESNTAPVLTTFNAQDANYYKTHVEQYFPRSPAAKLDGTPDRVTLRFRLQPIGDDLLDDLQASGDLNPNDRPQMPVYTLGASALEWTPAASVSSTITELGLRAYCVATPNFNVSANRVPAVNHTRCTP
jgi:hypothetical protein